jgi:hypothetical protein
VAIVAEVAVAVAAVPERYRLATGASICRIVARARHKSASTALRYQLATEDRDRVLAEAPGNWLPRGRWSR